MKRIILLAVISLPVLFATANAACTVVGADCTRPGGQQGVCMNLLACDPPFGTSCPLYCVPTGPFGQNR